LFSHFSLAANDIEILRIQIRHFGNLSDEQNSDNVPGVLDHCALDPVHIPCFFAFLKGVPNQQFRRPLATTDDAVFCREDELIQAVGESAYTAPPPGAGTTEKIFG